MGIEYIIAIGICVISTYFLIRHMKSSSQLIEEKDSFIIENKEIFIKELEEISRVKKWRIMSKGADYINFKTRFTWKSWGEYISITILKDNIVEISSKPIIKSTVLDYGKNMDNIRMIKSIL